MPPNRKAKATDPLPASETFQGFISTSPYALLAGRPSETEPGKQPNPSHLTDAQYWNRRAQSEEEILLQDIVREERICQLFSVDHIANNLVVEALRQKNEQVSCGATRLDNSDYWFMPTAMKLKEHGFLTQRADRLEAKRELLFSSGVSRSRANETDCWNRFPGTDSERVIKEILDAERVRQLLTVEHVEQNLLGRKSSCNSDALKAENDSYWTF
jgi:hypothetical protein